MQADLTFFVHGLIWGMALGAAARLGLVNNRLQDTKGFSSFIMKSSIFHWLLVCSFWDMYLHVITRLKMGEAEGPHGVTSMVVCGDSLA
jgi:hypothetical protein